MLLLHIWQSGKSTLWNLWWDQSPPKWILSVFTIYDATIDDRVKQINTGIKAALIFLEEELGEASAVLTRGEQKRARAGELAVSLWGEEEPTAVHRAQPPWLLGARRLLWWPAECHCPHLLHAHVVGESDGQRRQHSSSKLTCFQTLSPCVLFRGCGFLYVKSCFLTTVTNPRLLAVLLRKGVGRYISGCRLSWADVNAGI